MHLGVLDLESDLEKKNLRVSLTESQKIGSNCSQCIDIEEGSILERYIRDLNGKDLDDQE